MIYNFSKNKGMFTEALINKTIKWYVENKKAFFKKSFVPVSIVEKNDKTITGKIVDAADVDYYGIYKGKYICFEVKETKNDMFSLSQLKEHQIEALRVVSENGGFSFLIINYANYENESWAIEYQRLEDLFANKVKRLSIADIKNVGVHLPLEFPGIIDWVKNLNIGSV